ncbi:uncharacterized protein BP01DRAFT_84460 [Aspergillus saccharolyticus JOP 1030-1]|uniref:Uncharacterized protein n=1 Tax=Aspergillus saccharolyticus JOP 1030-1 TaxID=1450539 RepID=A0A318ZD17_9EURO|nr:hypothetical protein BP01DRAFT_84460 [Aspergillus saccharolyticus JOP 1030-1]PYH44204.1 hypothetical protein BP01DRAFT_84460 [Aspergillus saccharolyticus JOP 1030-1]
MLRIFRARTTPAAVMVYVQFLVVFKRSNVSTPEWGRYPCVRPLFLQVLSFPGVVRLPPRSAHGLGNEVSNGSIRPRNRMDTTGLLT